MPIRETPILDDYDCDEDDQMGHTHTSTPNQVHNQLSDGKVLGLEEYGPSQGTLNHSQHTDSLRKGEDSVQHSLDKRALDPKQETVDALMRRFKESFRTNTTPEISHFQHNVTHNSSTGRNRGPSHTRGKTKAH
ncbi:unnamed protein product [Oncorhynchus mykiss]|uniref:Uncharacterized protein n=1 Tax=Oncorhynchus mykiss TaxID=8022 RepID=A0A060X316_ONCMY|nr:unnamed protein product [Oncorhynchus mykiss]